MLGGKNEAITGPVSSPLLRLALRRQCTDYRIEKSLSRNAKQCTRRRAISAFEITEKIMELLLVALAQLGVSFSIALVCTVAMTITARKVCAPGRYGTLRNDHHSESGGLDSPRCTAGNLAVTLANDRQRKARRHSIKATARFNRG